jgi:hypothetical protein
LENVPVALFLRLIAMAQQRDRSIPGQPLDEAKSKFLAVVLDGFRARVNGPVLEKLPAVLARERRPRDFPARNFLSSCSLGPSEGIQTS